MPLSSQTRDTADALVRRYPVARSALLPLLHLVQAEQGHVTDEGITFCAERLGLTKAEVGAVSSFYSMFKREPVGDWLVSICTNPTCRIAGADEIYERFQRRLGGHHDPESGVTVEHAECLGICDAAPVIQVNYEMYGPLPDDEVDGLLDGCMRGEPPISNWSNERPGTFREVSWELSGASDPFGEELARAAEQQVAYPVPPAYRSGETDIPVTHPGGDPMGIGGNALRQFTVASTPAAEPATQATPAEEAAAARTAEQTGGEAEELAEHVTGRAHEPTPAEQDQPVSPAEGDVPAESAGQQTDAGDGEPAGGDVPGESGPDEDTKQPPRTDDDGGDA